MLIDQEAQALDFALRCAAAGHSVRWFRYNKGKPLRDGEGFKQVTIVEDWREHMPWAKDGLIWCSGNFRYLHELDRFRTDFGYKVFAPTVASARLEIERGVGMEAMKAAGMQLPHYEMFDSLEAAEKFARKSDRAWVFKPLGDTDDKSATYVSRDPADLVGWLRRKIAAGMSINGQCMLQEKVELLTEFGVSGWFGPEGFLPDKWQICFEHKPLMNGDIGPNTGEQGTVCQYVEEENLAAECLAPLSGALAATGHRGDFAVGVGIDTAGRAWPFEFTARAGWPAFQIQCASHRGDPARWMRDLLDGKDTLRVSNDVAIGVVCAQPRYPYNNSPPEMVEGNPIEGLDSVWNDVHPVAVMRGKGPMMRDGKVVEGEIYQTSGEYVLVATGLGKTVEEAQKRVYKTVKKIHFPSMMFRTDIGDKVKENLSRLHSFGYAESMEAH